MKTPTFLDQVVDIQKYFMVRPYEQPCQRRNNGIYRTNVALSKDVKHSNMVTATNLKKTWNLYCPF